MVKRTLRPYQNQGIRDILMAWYYCQRVILVMPTGAGKSFLMFSLVQYLVEHTNAKIVMAVRKRNLVFQLEEDARDFGLDYGVTMAGEAKNNKAVQICSIDTLRARAEYPHAGEENVYLFIDECDESDNESYHNFRDAYPTAKELGVTATPYNGLSFYEKAIVPTTAEQLTKEGVLTPIKYIVPKKKIDALTLNLKNGDYDNEQIDAATVVGDIVGNYLLYGDNRQTMAFCNSVKKSRELVASFQAAGITAVHCDAETPEETRRASIAMFKRGEVRVISNVKLFTRGTNIIEIGCIIGVNPTTKLNLYIQVLGRGVRANPMYKDLIYIDHAGNCLTHGEFTADREINLGEKVKFTRADIIEAMRVCGSCFRAFTPVDTCPYCGANCKKEKVVKAKNLDGKMREMSPEEFEKIRIIKFFNGKNGMYKKFKHYERAHLRGGPHIKTLQEFGLGKCLDVKKEIKLKKWHVIKWAKATDLGFIDLSRSGLE